MIARHEQITTMAAHTGVAVEIWKRSDGKGSWYTFRHLVTREKIGHGCTPSEAIAWLQGYQAACNTQIIVSGDEPDIRIILSTSSSAPRTGDT